MTSRAKTLFFLVRTLLFRAKTLLFSAINIKVCERKSLEDRISELLEELIVHMVSMLTMQEAGRTSVLSKRWRYVWAYVTVLNFDASDTLDKLMLTDKKLLEVEKLRFLSWVNQVVGSYKGPTIDAFRVVFDLSLTSGFEIDNWVKFALEKRVKQLALCSIFCGAGKQTGCYTSRDLLICNSLTCLNLYYVNVTGQVDNCPSLKYLLVVESKSLETLEVEIDFNVKHTMKYVDRFPQCKKLKELIVSVDLYSDNDLVCFATLIKACPNLQKFKMLECERKLLEDRISELPEELIVHMVSMLTMKEAGRTSVLSKRWRYVWAYVTALTFDASDTFDKLMWTDKKSLEVEKLRFLSWLNQILESYKGPAIDAFRVVFDLSVVSGFEIDNWVKFAMEKRVKKFELCSIFHVADKQTERYTFRDLLIWNSLTDLTLAYVNVTGEVLRSFLDNCRSLEYLSVTESKSLETLEASGAILNLKGLMIYRCFEIKHIEICAPNLVLFMYFGPKISFPFERFPKLTELSIGGKYGEYLTNNFLEFSSCLSQLEFLVLEIDFNVKHAMKSVDRFPQCKKLKELIVVVDLYFDIDLVCFAAVIKACPNLQKFEIELYWNKTVNERDCIQVKREACPHGNLKIVEIEGFIGHTMDLELIMYLVENCVALEKIVVHLCEPVHLQHLADSEDAAAIEKARMQAENLRAMLKHGIDLIII